MASSKKGISAHQLHRRLGITYKSAWFLTHRIREAMRAGGLLAPMSIGGKAAEVHETFYGRLEGAPKTGRSGYSNKNVVLTLVELAVLPAASTLTALALAKSWQASDVSRAH